jgi:hypothetical protein
VVAWGLGQQGIWRRTRGIRVASRVILRAEKGRGGVVVACLLFKCGTSYRCGAVVWAFVRAGRVGCRSASAFSFWVGDAGAWAGSPWFQKTIYFV